MEAIRCQAQTPRRHRGADAEQPAAAPHEAALDAARRDARLDAVRLAEQPVVAPCVALPDAGWPVERLAAGSPDARSRDVASDAPPAVAPDDRPWAVKAWAARP